MTDRTFYVNTITIRVLSEDEPYDFASYEDLAYDVTEGHFVGIVEGIESTEVASKQMVDALYSVGSQPEFFQLDDDGNEVED